MSVYKENKKIAFVYKSDKAIAYIYKGSQLVWQAVRSCFGSGKWLNKKPWINKEAWKN